MAADPRASRILVVEDDIAIGPQLVAGLIREGFDAMLAADGPTGRKLAASEGFDLVVLDLMLPGEDGFSLLEAWRFRAAFPVIVLTARTGLDDRLHSFELGASGDCAGVTLGESAVPFRAFRNIRRNAALMIPLCRRLSSPSSAYASSSKDSRYGSSSYG